MRRYALAAFLFALTAMCTACSRGGHALLPVTAQQRAAEVDPMVDSAHSADWPQMLHGPLHQSISMDSSLTASVAPSFGVRWMANLYAADLGSPVVAYNARLGKRVVYAGNQRADLFAIDASNGQLIWSINLGINDKIEDTPAIDSAGNVWVGTSYNPSLYKIDGATGKTMCSIKAVNPVNGSPMIVTPPGGAATVYWDYIDTEAAQGPLIATRQSDCSEVWRYTAYKTFAGSWTTPAYGVTAAGEPLIVIGTADPDSREYAIDANTGKLVWQFAIANPPPGFFDIGDAATISPPGLNGIAGGAVYFDTKYGDEYALDLATGSQLWRVHLSPDVPSASSSRASAALQGRHLIVGYGQESGFGGSGGVYMLDAVTGAALWRYHTATEVLSSPVVAGPQGNQIVAFGEIGGAFTVLDRATGAPLYKYQTRSYVTSSPAISSGTVFIASSDGFLYAFAPGGSNASAPSAAVTSPANGSVLDNPNGTMTITGTAGAASGVAAVDVAVQRNGQAGPWYSDHTAAYNGAPVRNAASLASPGAATSTWTYSFPVPLSGGSFRVIVNAVAAGGVAGRRTETTFTVRPSMSVPNITLSELFVAPGDTLMASSSAFASNEPVTFSMFGTPLATTSSTAAGDVLPTAIVLPTNSIFGPAGLTLTGQYSGKTTTSTIYITNNWAQFGRNATHNSFEPNDTSITAAVSVGNGSVLSQSWYYDAGAPVNSSPSIVDGVAYFGNDAGTMTALLVNSGAPLWTYHVPGAAPIDSAPAFTATGHLYFTAADSSLYELDSSGALVRSTLLGGTLTSPVTANDDVLVASSSGSVSDISDASGNVLWSASLPGAISAPVAFDASSKTVAVVDAAGNITALDAGAQGGQLWQKNIGVPITAAPLIADQDVFVGAQDGNVYAFSLATGTLRWKRAMSAPIMAAPAVYGRFIAVGDSHGLVELLTAGGDVEHKTITNQAISAISGVPGNLFVTQRSGVIGMIRIGGPVPFGWSYRTSKPLTTVAAVVDGTVYVASAEGGLYAFTPQGANPLARRTRR